MSTENKIKKLWGDVRDFWLEKEKKIVVFLAMILISVISFEAGVLKGSDWQRDPVVIEKVPESQVVKVSESGSCIAKVISETSVLGERDEKGVVDEKVKNCEFVGSKNSNKYHKKTCTWAKRIKEQNRVCFESVEDAKSKNYVPAGCCMK